MDAKNISFLMPTFNRGHLITESIGAVLSQMDDRDELIIIDDGSTDNTAEVVAGFGGRIQYVRQANAGKSAALNNGLNVSAGEFIWICDDDDILISGAVKLLADRLVESDHGFVCGSYIRFFDDEAGRSEIGPGYWPDLSSGSLTRHILEDPFICQNAMLVRRSVYDAVGPFDETMLRSLDYEMLVRLVLNTSFEYVDEPIFKQRVHAGVRGPANALHSHDKSEAVWATFDRQIFDRLDPQKLLQFLLTIYDCFDEVMKRRAALLERACVFARHNCWGKALDDLDEALGIAPGLALDPLEKAICRRILNGKLVFGLSEEIEAQDRLQAFARRSALARSIYGEMVAGALWMLRHGDEGRRRAIKTVFSRSDVRGFAKIGWSWAVGRRFAGAGRIRELQHD